MRDETIVEMAKKSGLYYRPGRVTDGERPAETLRKFAELIIQAHEGLEPIPVNAEDFNKSRREALKKDLFEMQNELSALNDYLKIATQRRAVLIARVGHVQAQLTILNAEMGRPL